MCVLFSPEILQAVAVKGLKLVLPHVSAMVTLWHQKQTESCLFFVDGAV